MTVLTGLAAILLVAEPGAAIASERVAELEVAVERAAQQWSPKAIHTL